MENPAAGVGAIEVGDLGNRLHTDIYLAGVWVSALDGLIQLARARADSALVRELEPLYTRAHQALEQRFWMEREGRYAFGLLEEGQGRIGLNDALTVWPATAIAFGQLDADRARRMMTQVAGANVTTDWGTRTLDRTHRLYEPLHYNNGAVWPFVTGFAAWAHYEVHRAWAGFDLVRDIARTGDDFALGVQPELMSGAFYELIDTAMPDQFFSTSMLVSPTLRGLVGFDADASQCRVTLAPQLPADWDHVLARRLESGCGKIDADIRRDAGRVMIAVRRATRGARAVHLRLAPALPLGAAITAVSVNGRSVAARTLATPHDVAPEVEADLADSVLLEVRYRGGAELVPQQTRPRIGDAAVGLRLLDWRLEQGRYVATIEGAGDQRFRVRTMLPLRVIEGGEVENRSGPFVTVLTRLGSTLQRRRVVLQ